MPRPKKPRPNCLHCDAECKEVGGKYCSNKCQIEAQYRRYIERWKAGEETGVVMPDSVSNHIQRYMREKYGEKCSQCGWAERNQTTGNIPLTLDHQDGNWQNNNEDNLRLLCPNCHSLTPNYGALNMGNGRASRRKGR